MPCGRHKVMTEVAGRNEWKVSAGQLLRNWGKRLAPALLGRSRKAFPLKAPRLLGSRHREVVCTRSAGWPGQIWSRRDQG